MNLTAEMCRVASLHTAEQIIRKLNTAEQLITQGVTVADGACRVIEVTRPSDHRWKL